MSLSLLPHSINSQTPPRRPYLEFGSSLHHPCSFLVRASHHHPTNVASPPTPPCVRFPASFRFLPLHPPQRCELVEGWGTAEQWQEWGTTRVRARTRFRYQRCQQRVVRTLDKFFPYVFLGNPMGAYMHFGVLAYWQKSGLEESGMRKNCSP